MSGYTFAEYLAAMPVQFGYVLEDRHVVAATMSRNGRPGPRMAAEWDTSTLPEADLAQFLAEHVARLVTSAPDHDRILLIGYGPDGARRASLLRDAVRSATTGPDPIPVHIQDGTWRAQVIGDRWTPALPLPDVTAKAVLDGHLAPATSREELAARYAPAPTATIGAVTEADAAIFGSSPPSFRAEVAIAHLGKIAQPAPDDTYQMAVLAHLTTAGPKAVRDAVMLAAAADRARVDALVRVYQGAPVRQRPTLAAAAGTAMFLSGGGSVETDAILAHAGGDRDAAHLALLVTTSKTLGFNPHELRAELGRQIKPALDDADTRWTAALSAKSFPKASDTPARDSSERWRSARDRRGRDSQAERG